MKDWQESLDQMRLGIAEIIVAPGIHRWGKLAVFDNAPQSFSFLEWFTKGRLAESASSANLPQKISRAKKACPNSA